MEDVVYTISELAKLLKCNATYVGQLRRAKLLPFLKLGCYKCRRSALDEFLKKYEGYDLTDPFHVIPINEMLEDDLPEVASE